MSIVNPRILPSTERLEKLQEKAKANNFRKLQNIFDAISCSNAAFELSDLEMQRCKILLSLGYEGIAKEKIDPSLVLKVGIKFKEYKNFPQDAFKEEVIIASREGKVNFNKHLLITRSPEFAKLIFSNENLSLDNSTSILRALSHYITFSHFDYNKTYDLKELLEIFKIGQTYKVINLDNYCLGKIKLIILSDDDLQHCEMLNEYSLPQDLMLNYISRVLSQNDIKGTKNEERVSLPLQNIYLLYQTNAFAKVLKPHVKSLTVNDSEDLNHLAELCLLPDKVKNGVDKLTINKSISLQNFKEILSHFPNLKNLVISIGPQENRLFFEAIAEIKTLWNFHLLASSDQYSIPSKFEEAMDRFWTFTVNNKCHMNFSTPFLLKSYNRLDFWRFRVKNCSIEGDDNLITLTPQKNHG